LNSNVLKVKQQQHKRIIISGGGTGGHVFPAIAIADALCCELEDPRILFVGARDKMEMEKVPQAGYEIMGLPIEGFRRKLSVHNFRVLAKLLVSLRMSGKLIREFKPDAVVGVGGYASGPVLRKAAGMGIPTLLQEQNSFAGVTNRLLAKKARKICVAYEGMEKYFPVKKIILTGNPVRREIRDLGQAGDLAVARQAFQLDSRSRVLLILGGSLGARTINEAVKHGLDLILGQPDISLIWQCGKLYYDEARQFIARRPGERIILQDFISRMDLAYQVADVIVARAGAITISELCHAAKPSILVPSPNVAEDHQTKNAQHLVKRSAALYIPDHEARESLMNLAVKLLGDEDQKRVLSRNIANLALPDSAGVIAREIVSMMK
jgi:UDP-N-acetylglucosamine--N-acetylmuramyl-(pentapeptide) pyrophosphoryl-undecaprenol N-acetylglucosamine transferase